ncbi:MAG: ribosome biogenesis/translation initiation ATPase RLI, partial [Candidatus Diapherotrites archaeon]|nr:ribosome biogenesis/translation initiation ATPase RLI [Candidatus Diapherotrites archaeon]
MNPKKRIAVIDYETCNYDNCGNYLCKKVCPVNRTGKKCITHEPLQKPIISEEQCIGCEICQNRCPFNAISIINISIDLGEVIHSFGKNQFRIHGLTVPKKNAVLGIIGRNGIGKTTIVKILSGNIIPNLGEKEGDKAKIIEYYRGKEEQEIFKKLYGKKLRIAVKPQNIEMISAKGSVAELLLKVDEKGKMLEVAKELNIEGILDHDASKLSGGEFQKVAIAATGLKNADIYFFDEPSSFLDIKERLRVAKYIRELSKNSAVLTVEHDLILLDYLSDYVNLMYGKPRVYGFVSQVKTTREGINTYLEGYSKDENYRFREYKIDFFSHQKKESKGKREKIIQWPAIEKKLGEFKLITESNAVSKNEIIGIVGPNGIGKTTFMKILAGEIEADNTKLENKVKIAYKPQYINYTGEKTVQELFEGTSISQIRQNVLRPLELEELLEKQAKHLSGGELQRVSIALCLSKKADIYLLDEPSAYLDVEQRLAVGKTIKNHIDVTDSSAL